MNENESIFYIILIRHSLLEMLNKKESIMGNLTQIGADIHIFLGILMPYKQSKNMKVDNCTVTKWLWVVRRASLLPVFLACIHS